MKTQHVQHLYNRAGFGMVQWKVDFRQIYATILDRWLGTDARKVLGKDFEQLGLL